MGKLITPGELAPNFELVDVWGKLVQLSAYQGQPILLVFLRGFM